MFWIPADWCFWSFTLIATINSGCFCTWKSTLDVQRGSFDFCKLTWVHVSQDLVATFLFHHSVLKQCYFSLLGDVRNQHKGLLLAVLQYCNYSYMNTFFPHMAYVLL